MREEDGRLLLNVTRVHAFIENFLSGSILNALLHCVIPSLSAVTCCSAARVKLLCVPIPTRCTILSMMPVIATGERPCWKQGDLRASQKQRRRGRSARACFLFNPWRIGHSRGSSRKSPCTLHGAVRLVTNQVKPSE